MAESLAEAIRDSDHRPAQKFWPAATAGGGKGHSYSNTLLRVSAARSSCKSPQALQTEAFGNASLYVVADNAEQLAACASDIWKAI